MRLGRWITTALICCLLCGCMKSHTAYTNRLRENNKKRDFARIEFPKCEEPLTLDAIISIALTNNLDLRVKQREWEVQREKATGEKLKMLPSLYGTAESSWRNKSTASLQTPTEANQPPPEPTISSPQRVINTDITLTWNLLDFGISYYHARQEHSKALSLKFQYEKARQGVIADVTKSYWKAVAADQAVIRSHALIITAQQQQLIVQQQTEKQNLSQLQGLKGEGQLIDIQIRLSKFQADYESAITELTALMGVAASDAFTLAPVERHEHTIDLGDIKILEDIALSYRPELHVADLEEKITVDEVRASLLEMFPTFSLFAGKHYDHSPYILHHHWMLTGLRTSWDLLTLPQKFFNERSNIAKKKAARDSRLALSIGIIAQVHLSAIKYENALQQYLLLDRMAKINHALYTAAKESYKTGEISGMDLLNYEAEALISEVDRMKSYGELQVAIQELNISIGQPFYFQ